MKSMLFVFACVWCFSRKVISTNCSSGLVRYATTHPQSHVLAVEFPRGVTPHLISASCKVVASEESVTAMFFLRGPSVLDVFYEKDLCKIWECSPYINEGVVIMAAGYADGAVAWTDSMTDWAVMPDFTVQFIAFSSFGIVLTLLLKVYCCAGNVARMPGD